MKYIIIPIFILVIIVSFSFYFDERDKRCFDTHNLSEGDEVIHKHGAKAFFRRCHERDTNRILVYIPNVGSGAIWEIGNFKKVVDIDN